MRIRPFLAPAALALWPFAFFLDAVVPVRGWCKLPFNDFPALSYPYKAYLLDELVRGRMPLWSPSEGAGYPFHSNPFAQAFYPLNIPLAAFRALAGGYTPLDHQRFTVLGLAVFALGLYAWLRLLVANRRAVVVAVLVMSVSFRMAEIRRFPNAVHSAAWYPWLLYALTRLAAAGSWRRAAGPGALLLAGLVLLLTAGYPYYAYYAMFVLVPYGLLLAGGALPQVPGPADRARWPSLAVGAVATTAALGLCAPHLVQMAELLGQTTDRAGGHFAYSTYVRFQPADTLGSLLYPPLAQTEGVYYFGMAGLLLLVWFLVCGGARRWATALALAWYACITSITYAADSALFRFLWNHLPGFSALRVWPRLNIVLVPFFAWMLALAYERFEGEIAGLGAGPTSSSRRRLAFVAAAAALVALQAFLYRAGASDPYWSYFPQLHRRAVLFPVAGATALLALAAVLWRAGRRPWPPRALPWLAAGTVALSAADLRPVGAELWMAPQRDVPRQPVDVARALRDSFATPRRDAPLFLSLTAHYNAAPGENWHYRRFTEFYRRESRDTASRDRLLGVTDGRRLFFSDAIDHADARSFLADADGHPGTVRVRSYEGGRLVARARTPRPGWLSFIDNWDPHWEAAVDGQPVPVRRLLGTFKSVLVPAGSHRVELIYAPRPWRLRMSGGQDARAASTP